ncbi:hypothetical protein Syun_017486 [Stephania yunnanensis]|uniref:Uncharacterized protein n=1 Tax=Stephania yunnanensis TaxID=152371 RepID=A0AAP0J756_9MAGN
MSESGCAAADMVSSVGSSGYGVQAAVRCAQLATATAVVQCRSNGAGVVIQRLQQCLWCSGNGGSGNTNNNHYQERRRNNVEGFHSAHTVEVEELPQTPALIHLHPIFNQYDQAFIPTRGVQTTDSAIAGSTISMNMAWNGCTPHD